MRYLRGALNNKGIKKWFTLSGLAVLILAFLVWLLANSWYQTNLQPLTVQSNEKVVVVELGSSTMQIGGQLERESLIKSSRAFTWYVSRLNGDQILQAGTYRLNSNMPVSEIVDILTNGRVDTSLVTVLAGLRLAETRQVLINAGFSSQAVTTALKHRYDHPIERFLPTGANLEGYIYPETYQISSSSTPETIVRLALDSLYKQLTPSLISRLKKQGLTVHQGVILASIVQKESSGAEDMPKIAQVFLKRLAEGIPLGADATFRYAAAEAGVDPTVDIDSPYNTRINAGLPPGPIGNFEISALNAVANPANSDFLYFLHGDDCLEDGGTCTTYFANTQAEHEANAAKYCRQNCDL